MATAEDLKTAFAAAGETMAGAISEAAGIWDEQVLPPEAPEVSPGATGDAWTPRQTVEHAVGALGFYRGLVAAATKQQMETPERGPLPSAEEAAAALTAAVEATTATLSTVEDGDLERPAGLPDVPVSYLKSLGIETGASVEGVLLMLAAHLEDHAAQIRRAL